jgi:hypothetical protein
MTADAACGYDWQVPAAPTRTFRRSVLRGYISELERLGVKGEIHERVPPEVALLLEQPQEAPSWVPALVLDEILIALVALRGREAARELGYRLMKGGRLEAVFAPIVSVALNFLGSSPAALLSRAQTMASVISQGIQLRWERTSENTGVIRICTEKSMPDSSWAAWEGAFLYAFELTGTLGEVSPSRPAPDDRCGETLISWKAAAPPGG